jgi:hypothetical protein
MLVSIKEYSFKTGKGIAVDAKGNEIEFNYKQLKNKKAVPVGMTAEIKNDVVAPAANKSILFWIFKQLRKVV